jgi:ribose/xylose/arabinose/galactoside ABC-type transport system permease subunit
MATNPNTHMMMTQFHSSMRNVFTLSAVAFGMSALHFSMEIDVNIRLTLLMTGIATLSTALYISFLTYSNLKISLDYFEMNMDKLNELDKKQLVYLKQFLNVPIVYGFILTTIILLLFGMKFVNTWIKNKFHK